MKRTPKQPILRISEIRNARRYFTTYNFFNVISFVLISGNIITLFALRLGAGSFLIGLLFSFGYISYLCIFIGRRLVKKLGVVRLMGRYWLLRYILMIPILFAPLLLRVDFQLAAFTLIVFSVFGFSVARGIAITGYNPIIADLTTEKDRGSFLARLQFINHTITLIVGIAMALLLGREAPIYRYTILIATGILSGFYASFTFFKIPEPAQIQKNLSENIMRGFKKALKRTSFRKFTLIHFLLSIAIFMITPFLIVYMKEVYQQPDNRIIFYTVFGSLGGILMALLSGFIIDRIGSQPLYFIYTGIITLTLVPLIISPVLNSEMIVLFAVLIFFFHNLGTTGVINTGQTYYLNAIRPEERVNLGAMFYLVEGLGGGIGALLGGILLNLLRNHPTLTIAPAYRFYYGVLTALFILLLILTSKVERLGAYTIRDTLGIIFSPRDLRAISLLNRLLKSRSISEEKKIMKALATSKSDLSIGDILVKLNSPRFTVRMEALKTIARLPADGHEINPLIQEVKNHTYTSAHLAAEILGNKEYVEGIGILRKRLNSGDYYLSGECMVALARLKDGESIPVIRKIIVKTANPRLIIHGARALEIFDDVHSIPILLKKLEKRTSPFLRDEIILSISGILGIGDWFYSLYITYLEKGSAGIAELMSFITGRTPHPIPLAEISGLCSLLPKSDRTEFARCALEHLNKLSIVIEGINISEIFSTALHNSRIIRLDRFCYLTTAVIIAADTGLLGY